MSRQYDWLSGERGPKMLKAAIGFIGTQEMAGENHNPVIMGWAESLHIGSLYSADEIPWCGLFVAYIAKLCGKPVPTNPLWARNWARWGESCPPELGCVLVFSRETGGHVGMYVGEDHDCYHVLGGNQGDAVSIARIKKSRLIAARCSYRNKPGNVRPVHLSASGEVSKNEA